MQSGSVYYFDYRFKDEWLRRYILINYERFLKITNVRRIA